MKLIYWILILFFLDVHFESLSSECLYQPSTNEGYLQIWNLNHHSKKIDLFITFMISNLGKGDFNNGVTIYFHDKEKHQTYLKMLEFTNQHLQAIENQLSISLELNNRLIYKENKLFIEIYSGEVEPYFVMNFALKMDWNQSIKSSYEHNEKKISYEILYFTPKIIEFQFESRSYSSFGVFGLECLRSEENILDITKEIYFFRNYDPKYKIAMILFHSSHKSFKGNLHLLDQAYSIEGNFQHNLDYADFKNETCEIKTGSLQEVGGFYVFTNVSKLLQWFLKLMGIDPYLKHYLSNLNLNCYKKQTKIPLIQLTQIHL